MPETTPPASADPDPARTIQGRIQTPSDRIPRLQRDHRPQRRRQEHPSRGPTVDRHGSPPRRPAGMRSVRWCARPGQPSLAEQGPFFSPRAAPGTHPPTPTSRLQLWPQGAGERGWNAGPRWKPNVSAYARQFVGARYHFHSEWAPLRRALGARRGLPFCRSRSSGAERGGHRPSRSRASPGTATSRRCGPSGKARYSCASVPSGSPRARIPRRNRVDPLLDQEGRLLPALLREFSPPQIEKPGPVDSKSLARYPRRGRRTAASRSRMESSFALLEQMPSQGRSGASPFPIPAWMLSGGHTADHGHPGSAGASIAANAALHRRDRERTRPLVGTGGSGGAEVRDPAAASRSSSPHIRRGCWTTSRLATSFTSSEPRETRSTRGSPTVRVSKRIREVLPLEQSNPYERSGGTTHCLQRR